MAVAVGYVYVTLGATVVLMTTGGRAAVATFGVITVVVKVAVTPAATAVAASV